MNNKYLIRVTHPLIRAGLEIETEASENYLVPVINTLMEKIRELNNQENDKQTENKKD